MNNDNSFISSMSESAESRRILQREDIIARLCYLHRIFAYGISLNEITPANIVFADEEVREFLRSMHEHQSQNFHPQRYEQIINSLDEIAVKLSEALFAFDNGNYTQKKAVFKLYKETAREMKRVIDLLQ